MRTPTSHALNTGKLLWLPGTVDYANAVDWQDVIGSSRAFTWSGGAPDVEAGYDPAQAAIRFNATLVSDPVPAFALPGSSGTLAVWLKMDAALPVSPTDTGFPVPWWSATNASHYPYTDGTAYLNQWMPDRPTMTPSASVPRDAWHLVAFVTNGTDTKVYQVLPNGTTHLIHTETTTIDAGLARYFLGAALTYRFVGLVGDICLWSRALSSAELGSWAQDIAANYAATLEGEDGTGPPPGLPETVTLAAAIPEAGAMIGFRLGAAAPATFAPKGSSGTPYAATLPFHPTIKVGGGAPITLANPLYHRIYGPNWVFYPLATPVTAGQVVTFSVLDNWIIGRVDAEDGTNPAYTDAPVTNAAGDPDSLVQALPPTRPMGVGLNFHDDTVTAADLAPIAMGPWAGPVIVDARGELQDFTGVPMRSLFEGILTPRPPGHAWHADHGPEKPFHMPVDQDGQWTIRYSGTFNAGDYLEDHGITPSSGKGPFANMPVSFATVTKDSHTAGTGGAKHEMKFTVTMLNTLTGHAPAGGFAGADDGVRPSRALCTQAVYRPVGGGPRTDFELYPPGVDPDVDTFHPTTLQVLTEWAPPTIRLMHHCLPVNYFAPPSAANYRRYADPTRTFWSYPEYDESLTVAVSSVDNYTASDYRQGLIPAGRFGARLKITTAAPHGLTRGCHVWVVGGVASLPTDGVDLPWDGRQMVVWPTSATELMVPCAWNSGLTADLLVDGPITSGLGSLKTRWGQSRLTVKEGIDICNAAGADPWVTAPLSFDDAALADFLDDCIAELGPGRKLIIEASNEIWNIGANFCGMQDTYCAQCGLPGTGATFAATVAGGAITGASVTAPGSGYFAGYGNDGWYDLMIGGPGSGGHVRAFAVGGVFTSVSVVAGGTGYSSAPTLTLPDHNGVHLLNDVMGQSAIAALNYNRYRTIGRARMVAAGRPASDCRAALTGQGEYTAYMESMVRYCERAGWPIDLIGGGNYDCFSALAAAPAWGWNDPTLYRSLSLEALLDAAEMQVAWTDFGAAVSSLRAFLDAHGYATTPIENYEGAIEDWASGELRSRWGNTPEGGGAWVGDQADIDLQGGDYDIQRSLLFSPRGGRVVRAWLNHYQARGLAVLNWFELNGDGSGAGLVDETWDVIPGRVMLPGVGDGSDGRFDNTSLAGLDISRSVSTAAAAFAEWNGGAAPPLVPDLGALTIGTVTDESIAVTVPNATGGTPPYTYAVEYRPGASGTWLVGGTGQSVTITGLTPETSYQVRGKVTDSAAAIDYSPVSSVTTAAGPGPGPSPGAVAFGALRADGLDYTIAVTRGHAGQWPFSVRAVDDSVTLAFDGTEEIAATVWQGLDGPPLADLTGSWIDAEAGIARLVLPAGESQDLSPGVYNLVATIETAEGLFDLHAGLLRVRPAPGTGTSPEGPAYCTYEEVEELADRVADGRQYDYDRARLDRAIGRASRWVDQAVMTRARRLATAPTTPASWGRPFDGWYDQSGYTSSEELVADLAAALCDGRLDASDARLREACARRALAGLPSVTEGMEQARMANHLLLGVVFRIDLDDDGVFELALPS